MTGFFNALSAVFVIFIIMALGYALGHLGWLTAAEKKFISKFVVNIAIPINCVTGVLNGFTRDEMLDAGFQVMVAAVVVGIMLLISAAAAGILKLPRKRWGVFVVMGGISNTMLTGVPVVTELFGTEGVPYLMMYYLFSTMYTQTAAVMLCEYAGGMGKTGKRSIAGVLKELIKKPPVLGVITAFGCLFLDVRPPEIIMSAGGYIAATVTPLALLYCGYILYEMGLRNLHFLPGLPVMLLLRLVLSPAVCWAVCRVMGVTGLAANVFVVMAALPVISQLPVFAGVYGADEEYAAMGASLSMLCMFVTLPVLMLIM